MLVISLAVFLKPWVVPPPRIPVANESVERLGFPSLNMFHVILVVTIASWAGGTTNHLLRMVMEPKYYAFRFGDERHP